MRPLLSLRWLVGSLVAAVAASAAFAQNREITVEQVGVTLLLNPKIQTELRMSKDQVQLVTNEFRNFQARTQGMFGQGMTEAQREAKVKELQGIQDGITLRVMKSLTATQKSRYRQLTLQSEGIWAVLLPEVSRALKLTPAQTKSIKAYRRSFAQKAQALQAKRRKEIEAIPEPKDPKDKAQVEAYRKKVIAVVNRVRSTDKRDLQSWGKAAMASAERVLTAKQRASWTTMLGPKFKPG